MLPPNTLCYTIWSDCSPPLLPQLILIASPLLTIARHLFLLFLCVLEGTT